jgi:hypothetical protein
MIAMPTKKLRFRLACLPLALFVSAGLAPAALRAEGWRLTVQPSHALPVESPVVVECPTALPVGLYAFEVPGASTTVAAQVLDDAGKHLLACVLPTGIGRGTFALRPHPPHDLDRPSGVSLLAESSRIAFKIDGNLVTEYRTDVGAKPFLFPLNGPGGWSYTRAYPMQSVAGEDQDHPHQRSFWFTHGKVNQIDFWSEEGNHGTIRETSRKSIISGPVLGRLRTTDDWLAPGGQKICEDERVLTIYETKALRLIDFDITIKAAPGSVTFGDTKEGMFGVRVASSMDARSKPGGKIVNADGFTDDRAWGKPAAWVDYSGPVHENTVGIAILNHPRSFRYPTTWHVRTYGLFAANPFGWHDFGLGKSGEHTLEAGKTLCFGYRVILHQGDAAANRIADAFQQFASPPHVEVALQ